MKPQTAAAAPTGAPAVVVSPTAVDFGTVDKGVRSAEVTVTNGTPNLVSWRRVELSCECLSFNIKTTRLEAGQEAKGVVEFDPAREPDFSGSLMMTVTAFDQMNAVVFTIEVTALVRPRP